jgi:hypothetical protein
MSSEAHPELATFRVHRDQDVSGISGTGVVAEGVQFSDGWVVTHWLNQAPMWEPKTDVWHHKGTGPVTKIHGHGGATRIVWTRDEEQARRELAAGIAQAFDVPPEVVGGEAEMECLLEELVRRLREASHAFERDYNVMEGFGSVPGPVQLTGYTFAYVDAITPMLEDLIGQRDRLRATLGRAYALTGRWLSAHGSSNFLVRAAGAELRDILDDSEALGRDVVHLDQEAQASDLSGVDEVAAAECSALHTGFPGDHRQCIRAAQHCGDHIDEHGFHWSDTVAVYPVVDTLADQHDRPTEGCSIPEHACPACGDCLRQHPTTGGCEGWDQRPPNQGPLTGIEVREACPYCTGGPMFPRRLLGTHIREKHARVLAVLARGESLDERLAAPESSCRLSHEMEL